MQLWRTSVSFLAISIHCKKYKYWHNYRRKYSDKDIPGDGCDIEGGFGKWQMVISSSQLGGIPLHMPQCERYHRNHHHHHLLYIKRYITLPSSILCILHSSSPLLIILTPTKYVGPARRRAWYVGFSWEKWCLSVFLPGSLARPLSTRFGRVCKIHGNRTYHIHWEMNRRCWLNIARMMLTPRCWFCLKFAFIEGGISTRRWCLHSQRGGSAIENYWPTTHDTKIHIYSNISLTLQQNILKLFVTNLFLQFTQFG